MKISKLRTFAPLGPTVSVGLALYMLSHPESITKYHDYPSQSEESQEFLEQKIGFRQEVENVIEEGYPGRGSKYTFRVHEDGLSHLDSIREELDIEDWWTKKHNESYVSRINTKMHMADKNHDGTVDYVRIVDYSGQLMPNTVNLPRTITIERARFGRIHYDGISKLDAEYYLDECTEVYANFLEEHDIQEHMASYSQP